jgi:anti-sigma B factor antagonist
MIDFTTYTAGNDDSVLVLELTGKLDDNASRFLFDCLVGHIEHGHSKLVLDCNDLDHIASVGLGTLARIHSRVKQRGGRALLVGVKGVVADVIRLVHFEKLFDMYGTVDEAVAEFDG